LSARAISGNDCCELRNENAEVREATRTPGSFDNVPSSSSEIPSEKKALAASSLMFVNGRTATEGIEVGD